MARLLHLELIQYREISRRMKNRRISEARNFILLRQFLYKMRSCGCLRYAYIVSGEGFRRNAAQSAEFPSFLLPPTFLAASHSFRRRHFPGSHGLNVSPPGGGSPVVLPAKSQKYIACHCNSPGYQLQQKQPEAKYKIKNAKKKGQKQI